MGFSDEDITTEPGTAEGPADAGAKGVPDVHDGGADGGADRGAKERPGLGPVDTKDSVGAHD